MAGSGVRQRKKAGRRDGGDLSRPSLSLSASAGRWGRWIPVSRAKGAMTDRLAGRRRIRRSPAAGPIAGGGGKFSSPFPPFPHGAGGLPCTHRLCCGGDTAFSGGKTAVTDLNWAGIAGLPVTLQAAAGRPRPLAGRQAHVPRPSPCLSQFSRRWKVEGKCLTAAGLSPLLSSWRKICIGVG